MSIIWDRFFSSQSQAYNSATVAVKQLSGVLPWLLCLLFSCRLWWIVVKLCCIIHNFKGSVLKTVGTENHLYVGRKHRRNGRSFCRVDFLTLLVVMVFIAFSICSSSRVPKLCVTKGCLQDLIGSYSSKAMAPKPLLQWVTGTLAAHHRLHCTSSWKHCKRRQYEKCKPLQTIVLTSARSFKAYPKYPFGMIVRLLSRFAWCKPWGYHGV